MLDELGKAIELIGDVNGEEIIHMDVSNYFDLVVSGNHDCGSITIESILYQSEDDEREEVGDDNYPESVEDFVLRKLASHANYILNVVGKVRKLQLERDGK